MVKKYRSIDGFVVNSADSGSSVNNRCNSAQRRPSIDRPILNDPDFKGNVPANHQASVKSDDKMNPEEQLISDIEDSLNQIDDIPPIETAEAPRRSRRARRQAEKAALKTKKKGGKKRIVKWIVIILIVAILGVLGYFAVKVYIAGGNVFSGNPLDMLVAKTRLEEDSDGRTNVLIFGTSGYSMDESAWDGAMLTDSIMVVSVDQDNHDAYMVSLPRDLYVRNECPVLGKTQGKLNEVFYCAYAENKDEKAGAEALMEKTGEILGLDIHYYAHADWTALVQAVDAVGGVDVKIESDDPRGIYDSSTGLKFANGEVAHLSGEKALALARARNHNYGDYGLASGNYAREQNQQKILIALQQKALSVGTLLNPVAVNGLIDSIGNNLITSFESGQVQTLIDLVSNIGDGDMKSLPLVGRENGEPDLVGSYSPGGSYAGEAPLAGVFDYSDIQSYIRQNLSSDPVIREGAVIDVLNGSEVAGLAGDEADELESDDFTIGEISNAPSTFSGKVQIYQLNNEMTGTAEALKKRYGGEVITGELSGYYTEADFIVVIGTAFSTDSANE